MNRPAPRTLTEKQQRTELANGDKWLEQALADIQAYAGAIIGRSKRLADQVSSLGNQSDIRVQQNPAESRSEQAIDWIESARVTLRQLLVD